MRFPPVARRPLGLLRPAAAAGAVLAPGAARMRPGRATLFGSCLRARSAVWFALDEGHLGVVVSDLPDLAARLRQPAPLGDAALLGMRVGRSPLTALTGAWHGACGRLVGGAGGPERPPGPPPGPRRVDASQVAVEAPAPAAADAPLYGRFRGRTVAPGRPGARPRRPRFAGAFCALPLPLDRDGPHAAALRTSCG